MTAPDDEATRNKPVSRCVLHIAGVVKHHAVDHEPELARMLPPPPPAGRRPDGA